MKIAIRFYSILLMQIIMGCKTHNVVLENQNFDYFVRRSTKYDFINLNEYDSKWREINKDTVIYTKYFRGASCDIPNENEMKINLKTDTIFFNFGLENITGDCEREIGVAGIMIDFVINKKKHPNYKSLKIKYISR